MRLDHHPVAQQVFAGGTELDGVHALQPMQIDVQFDLIERNSVAPSIRHIDAELRRHVAFVNGDFQFQIVLGE